MALQANAILAISSTDRYIKSSSGNVNQPVSDTLLAQYRGGFPFSNDFTIEAPNALMNGYIDRIVISQIQLQYNLPTVIPTKNNLLIIFVETAQGTGFFNPYSCFLPYGFYTPTELAVMLQMQLNYAVYGNPQNSEFTVMYNQKSTPPEYGQIGNTGFTIFLFDNERRFYFPSPNEILAKVEDITDITITSILKCYKLFGIDVRNQNAGKEQTSFTSPQFLFTPFIDIYSDALTNYQKLKDTDSSVSKRKGLIARLYLSGVGSPVSTVLEPYLPYSINLESTTGGTITEIVGSATPSREASTSLGSCPFVMTCDLNNPKVVNWSSDTAINSLDFQMRDCYGDLLFSALSPNVFGDTYVETFNTEFQMTLLCIEG